MDNATMEDSSCAKIWLPGENQLWAGLEQSTALRYTHLSSPTLDAVTINNTP